MTTENEGEMLLARARAYQEQHPEVTYREALIAAAGEDPKTATEELRVFLARLEAIKRGEVPEVAGEAILSRATALQAEQPELSDRDALIQASKELGQ